MKKLKTFAITLLLSTVLVANVFASDSAGGGGLVSFLTAAVGSVASFFGSRGSDSCPLRQCSDCRPNEGNDDNGNCRPPA